MADVVEEVVEEIIEEEVSEEVEEVVEEEITIDSEDSEENKEEIVNDDSELVVTIDGEEEEKEEAPAWVKDLRKQNRDKNKEIRDLKTKLETFTTASKEVELGKKPNVDDYEYGDVRFEKDLTDWIERKRVIDEKAAASKKQDELQAKEWQDELDAYKERAKALNVKNFEEIEDNVKDILSITQQSIVIQACVSPEKVMIALDSNPEIAKKLASITNPVKFAGEIVRLESKMKVEKRRASTSPEKVVKSTGGAASLSENKLAKLEEEAGKTRDRSKLVAYKRTLMEKENG
jgi:hypothetical protein